MDAHIAERNRLLLHAEISAAVIGKGEQFRLIVVSEPGPLPEALIEHIKEFRGLTMAAHEMRNRAKCMNVPVVTDHGAPRCGKPATVALVIGPAVFVVCKRCAVKLAYVLLHGVAVRPKRGRRG